MLHFLYRFIARDSDGKDVFAHVSALERSDITLSARDKLSSMFEGRKGPGAEAVQRCAWSRPGTQKRA
jgi:cold shock CspA family protein